MGAMYELIAVLTGMVAAGLIWGFGSFVVWLAGDPVKIDTMDDCGAESFAQHQEPALDSETASEPPSVEVRPA
jgi:hypothetical protein